MARESQRLEQEFIASARVKTGKDVPEWIVVIDATGMDKPNTILKWLKETYGLNHMQANFMTGIYLNGGQPVYDYEVLFARLFDGKEQLRPLYEMLAIAIHVRLPDAEFIPTKSYISIEGKKCFACATLTRQTIRMGFDLGAMPFDEYVQKAKSLGAMPNLTHMVEIAEPCQVDERLLAHVEQAYSRTHSP